MPTQLVSPVASLTAQVSMCPIHVGACVAGGQGPVLMGLLFLWGGCDKEGVMVTAGSLRSWPEGSNPDLVKPLDSAADFQEAQRTEGHSEWCFADEVSQVHPVGSSMRQMVFLPK